MRDDNEQVKIELLSQWMLEAEFRNTFYRQYAFSLFYWNFVAFVFDLLILDIF